MLLPTDSRVVEALEVFMHHGPQGASEDPQSPPSPHVVLKEYFDASNTTPTLLLYHLEVQRLTPFYFNPFDTAFPFDPGIKQSTDTHPTRQGG